MSHRIRIAFLINSLKRGGTENQLLHLLKGLDSSRFELHLILLHGAEKDRAAGLDVRIHELRHGAESFRHPKGRLRRTLHTIWKLIRCLRRVNPDILHCYLPTACVLGVIAGKAAGVPKIVCSRRALTHSYGMTKLLAAADRFAMNHADLVLANSRAVSGELRDLDNVPSDRIRLIYNGVDVAAFREAGPNGLRRRLDLDENTILVGTVANFFAYKRHDVLVEAARLLTAKHPSLCFVATGREEGTRREICQKIDRYGLSKHFKVLDESKAVLPFFRSIDIYACPSETEGFSNALLEAMAAQKPVVATAVGGNPEAVNHGKTGFIVESHSPHALAAAIETLILDPTLRTRMGAAGARRVEAHFSVQTMVQRHAELYAALASPQQRPRS